MLLTNIPENGIPGEEEGQMVYNILIFYCLKKMILRCCQVAHVRRVVVMGTVFNCHLIPTESIVC